MTWPTCALCTLNPLSLLACRRVFCWQRRKKHPNKTLIEKMVSDSTISGVACRSGFGLEMGEASLCNGPRMPRYSGPRVVVLEIHMPKEKRAMTRRLKALLKVAQEAEIDLRRTISAKLRSSATRAMRNLPASARQAAETMPSQHAASDDSLAERVQ